MAGKPGTDREMPSRSGTSGPETLRGDHTPATELIPPRASLTRLREAAAGCRACPLWRTGTQTVFGKGSPRARLMLIGEQPGDREDRAGEPFVGPAGEVLDKALTEA